MRLPFVPGLFRPLLSLTLLVGLCAGVCTAPQAPTEPNIADRGPLADKFVRDRLPVWQERLNLKDWKIKILSVHPSDLRAHTMGNIHWDADKRTAVIRVLNASDYQMPYHATLNDMEFTIVHELIHLELVSLPRSEASRSDEEHAINNLAGALLQFDRKDTTLDALNPATAESSDHR